MYNMPQTKKESNRKETIDAVRGKRKEQQRHSLVKSFDRVVRRRLKRVETVVVTRGAVNDVPGCGWVVQSVGINRV